MKRKKGTKFLPSSFTLLFDILYQLIQDPTLYPAKVARLLGKSKQHVHYYVKRLVKMGYIRRFVKDGAVFYEVTQAGKNFVTRSESLPRGFVFRLHGYGLVYPILKEPVIAIDWPKVVEMKHWNKLIGSEQGLTVEKTPRSVIIYADVLEGDDPFELLYLAGRECDRLADYLESKFKMVLGRPKPKDRPDWGVWDPVAQKFSEYMRLSNDVADIDRSPPYRKGEIDWRDPESAKNYLLTFTRLPVMLQEQRKDLTEVKDALGKYVERVDQRLDVMEKGMFLAHQKIDKLTDMMILQTASYEKGSEEQRDLVKKLIESQTTQTDTITKLIETLTKPKRARRKLPAKSRKKRRKGLRQRLSGWWGKRFSP